MNLFLCKECKEQRKTIFFTERLKNEEEGENDVTKENLIKNNIVINI